jgi:hypothetical protein
VRDASFRNRIISCPECHEPVQIVEQDGTLTGIAAVPQAEEAGLFSRPTHEATWPRNLAIALSGIILLVIGWLTFFTSRSERPTPADVPPETAASSMNEEAAPPGQPPEATADSDVASVVPAPASSPSQAAPPPVDNAESHLRQIGSPLMRLLQEQGAFPGTHDPGASAEWSWIALLADGFLPPGPRRQTDQDWNAPGNDEFVRRSFPMFLNPAITTRAGDDHYPTTHFSGITGLGAEAARLPKNDPRAGIFSDVRRTRAEDVTDGLSQTMMVAGITRHLGAWARPDTATARAFTQEPYVNGPDGFGAGSSDGMPVLMADGSVRQISRETSPEVIRQLVTLAGSTPVPVAAPASPALQQASPTGSSPALPAGKGAPVTMSPAGLPAADLPIPVPVTPEVPRVDLAARLKQPVAGFRLSQPAPLEDVLFDVQELIGVPIDVSSLPEVVRQRPVTVTLENTTAGEILKAVATQADLGYTVGTDRIQVQTRP